MCFRDGKGANVLPLFYRRGQMSTIIHLLRGQISYTVNHLGGGGADVLIYHFSQGGRCPRGQMSGSPKKLPGCGHMSYCFSRRCFSSE